MFEHSTSGLSTVVEIEKLTRRFEKKCALNGLSLTIPRGGVLD